MLYHIRHVYIGRQRCPGQFPLPGGRFPRREWRALRHISPSSPSPPPTPRIPKKRRRTSDAGETAKKRRVSTTERPMFEQGSSTSTTAPSLRVQTRPCGGPSDLGHAPSQMSPEYAESFSDGRTYFIIPYFAIHIYHSHAHPRPTFLALQWQRKSV